MKQNIEGKIQALESKFIDAVVQRYESTERWRIVVQLILTAGGTAILGIGRIPILAEATQIWFTAIGLFLGFLGAAFICIFEVGRASFVGATKDALNESRLIILERDTLLGLDEKRRYLLDAQSDIYEVCEALAEEPDITKVVEAILDTGINNITGAIGFDPGEDWAFSVFRRTETEDGPEVMVRIAVVWADRQAQHKSARDWYLGEGFTGLAWKEKGEVIVKDATDTEHGQRYDISTAKELPSDKEKYISVAAIPIKVGTQDDVWGVVTATSNKVGRFMRRPNDIHSQNVDTVRVLARLIASQVAIKAAK